MAVETIGFRNPEAVTGARLWNIPQPVENFTGRLTALAKITRSLSRASGTVNVVALHGMSGMGKTQLAMAYAEQQRPTCAIGWWITASDRLWVVAGLAELAHHLGVASPGQEQESAARAAVAALGRLQGWLLVFDDAADESAIAGLVPSGAGRVVITSRHPEWEAAATVDAVAPLSNREAVRLLLAHSGDSDVAAAGALASDLQGLPLAVAQAGTYCRLRALTLTEYHKRFTTGRRRVVALGAGSHQLPVTLTAGFAVDQLRRRNAAAFQLIRLLAFLGPEAVPRNLPSYAPQALPRELSHAVRDSLALDEAVEALVSSSLVSLDRPGFIRVHRLVQALVRDEVQNPSARRWRSRLRWITRPRDGGTRWTGQRWLDAVGTLLATAFPGNPGDRQQWTRCAALSPHLDAYIARASAAVCDKAQLDTTSRKLAAYLHGRAARD